MPEAKFVDVTTIPMLDPQPFYQMAAPESGLERIILPSGHLAYHATRYEQVQEVLLSRQLIREPSNREGAATVFPTLTPQELLLNNDHPGHARLKAFVAKDFSPSGVSGLRPLAAGIIAERIEGMKPLGGSGDLFAQLLDHVPSQVVCRFLGLPLQDMAYYRPLSQTVQIASRADVSELTRQFSLVYGYLMDLVRGRRQSLPGGYLQRALDMRGAGEPPLTDEELVGILIGILLGGDQNVLSALTKIVYALLAAPSLYARLVADKGLIPAAIEELFRVIPLGVVSAFPRIAGEDTVFSWGTIPKGAAVYPNLLEANRDPDVFNEPLNISFGREGRRHLQFGYGMHACMGAALARMVIQTVIEKLVTHIPTLRLAVSPELVPWRHGLILRRPEALPVCWQSIT
ncbi:Cytochrome [Burkholderia sp. 8Y]|uniref:cytochrome P450 n=1 Tax=Burkholderia sp. 8Y TaxID=2653133 RepID=UPI0012EEFD0E|nr:cytochrome P450 [Burkholderia sp. 8Y]VXC79387.1 Cytochrome [Burkholderia sp. 8Y]